MNDNSTTIQVQVQKDTLLFSHKNCPKLLLILLAQMPVLQVRVNGDKLNDVLNFTMALQTER